MYNDLRYDIIDGNDGDDDDGKPTGEQDGTVKADIKPSLRKIWTEISFDLSLVFFLRIHFRQEIVEDQNDFYICLKIVPPLLMTMKVFLSERETGQKPTQMRFE